MGAPPEPPLGVVTLQEGRLFSVFFGWCLPSFGGNQRIVAAGSPPPLCRLLPYFFVRLCCGGFGETKNVVAFLKLPGRSRGELYVEL